MIGRLGVILALAFSASIASGAETGDAARGETVFKKCMACHMVGMDAKNRVGPVLNDVFGPAASVEGFRYSKSLQNAADEGLEWTNETLTAFLENPKKNMPGTRMSFRGLSDAQDRADVIAYLASFSEGAGASAANDNSDHDLDPAILAIVGDAEYGEYLSSECTSCHRADGGDDGIPSITLWPEEDFVVAMHAYKTKAREHPVMNMIAGRLGDEEIAALAAYFANLEN